MTLSRIAAVLLLVTAVAAHGHHHRHLLAPGNSKTNGKDKGGHKFDFPKGTARGFLDKMDQAQVEKILQKAHFSDKSALAQELENDADLVSNAFECVHLQLFLVNYKCRSCVLVPLSAPANPRLSSPAVNHSKYVVFLL